LAADADEQHQSYLIMSQMTVRPNHTLLGNPAIAFRLQSNALVGRLAELLSLVATIAYAWS
jgi:hypothetical protein